VCYGGEFGPDMEEVASTTGLTPDEVIARHTASVLEVAIMGFLPGLGYMTGVDEALYLPRRSEPRTHVAKGSVGIAMDQTVIYPLDSPGGWNLIGRMPIPLFDQARDNPILFSAGDRVCFYAVSRREFDELEAACADGRLPVRPEPEAGTG
ncbi:MAG: allophanate hydrolase subunit 1, partial [Pseudomonadota bacterium]|nr:allophanate hydrolase subunit 1 [Pseudomonadota bacterium]